ncbi:MAG: hypothetical protein ACKVP0_21195 [Pirellulaceae bacterium]
MSNVLGILESSDSSGHLLRLIFEQIADRVAHRVEVLNSTGEKLAEFRSVEGTSADEWPASPALQSCSFQEIRPGQTAAFLVGMSGKSHWSASIEAISGRGALDFDFACRVSQEPQWLGTTYAIDPLSPWSGTQFQLGPTGMALELAHASDKCVCEVSGKSLRFSCVQKAEKYPATIRWRYGIHLAAAIK